MTRYQRALQDLLARQHEAPKHGLPEVRAYLRSLGEPQDSFKTIHVTGTNGKGSVCALLAQTLVCAGYKTGLFTSPHLVDMRERIQINGRPIPRRVFCGLLEEIAQTAPVRLTFFETLSCAAFLYFSRSKLDCAVIEVGIGGRLDATNALTRPEAAVITSVGLDHMKMLGDTVEKIAFEKAGIMKPGVPCICGKLPAAALAVVKKEARRLGATLLSPRGKNVYRALATDWGQLKLLAGNRRGHKISLNLLGRHQDENASIVAETAAALNRGGMRISDHAFKTACRTVSWPARFQMLKGRKNTMILDGGHNPDAAKAFSETLSASPFDGNATMVLGLLRDKDCRSIVKALRPHLKQVIVTEPVSPRALKAATLAALVRSERPDTVIAVAPQAARALKKALRLRVSLVVGSFYLAGLALAMFRAGVKNGRKC
ncbi:MAG TPA: folylpolyglutamate synthase/dihydrofolate synthase family protein [Elusimicrobiales bacterium]|nr:folylpolyglutamate synthase/dihydrofolate synthase family protein [Elusimicrobiales bacterium]